ncbi:MAG: MaoC family dehydratase [Haloferacaceae archaeon]
MEEQATFDPSAPMREFTSSWLRSSRHLSRGLGQMYRGIAEANRAFVPGAASVGAGNGEASDDDAGPGDRKARVDADVPEVAFSRGDWTTERTVDDRTDLGVGDAVRFSKPVTDDDVTAFANASGDTNRLHLDEEFAERTRFGGRIVHGTLVAGLVSAALARLPGLTIYLSQDLEFLKPVEVGERLTAVVEVVEDIGDGRYRLDTSVGNEDGEPVIDGEAVVIVDDAPDGD